MRFKNGINIGSAALPTIILIAGIVLEVAIAGALVAYYLSESGVGAKNSAEAFQSAQTGIQDATIKALRGQFPSPPNYELTIDSRRKAEIVVCRNLKYNSSGNDCSGGANLGKIEIASLGRAGLKSRRLFAVLNVDSTSGEIRAESLTEI